jgi:phage terminase large subunit-like protein
VAVDSSFTIKAQDASVEYIGGTKTQNVVVIGAVTNAHQTYYEARVPQQIYTAGVARAAATALAVIIETIYSLANVVGVQWGQRTNASGLLIDTVTVTVASDSQNSTGVLGPLDVVSLGPQLHNAQIQALNKQLTAAEGPSV